MAHAWKACWVQALGGSNPPSSATNPGPSGSGFFIYSRFSQPRLTPPISAHSRPCFFSTTPPHAQPAAAYHAAPCDVGNKNPATHCMTGISGGSAGIRTRGGLHHTAFRVLHLRPLGHATSAAQFTGDYSQYANFTYPATLTQKCTSQTRHAVPAVRATSAPKASHPR